jgi:hypothetical protein
MMILGLCSILDSNAYIPVGVLRRRQIGPFFRNFSLHSHHYAPQNYEKLVSHRRVYIANGTSISHSLCSLRPPGKAEVSVMQEHLPTEHISPIDS